MKYLKYAPLIATGIILLFTLLFTSALAGALGAEIILGK